MVGVALQHRYSVAARYLAVAIITAVLALALCANSDLKEGRHVLFMDERITFDGVRAILHPDSFRAFARSVLDGGDQRYGRILWNATAAASAIPERAFGPAGQIFATRMTMAACLATAYVVLAAAFLRTWAARSLLLLALASLPGTVYFATMPKPEPVMLLCLAIFLFLANAREFEFGRHWFFLGLAFGAKISLTPALPIVGAVGSLRERLQRRPGLARRVVEATAAFVLGLVVAVPILAVGRFRDWLEWTFRNTGHGADRSDIDWLVWIRHIVFDWMPQPAAVTVALALLAGAVLAAWAWHSRRRACDADFWRIALLVIVGASLTVPVIVAVRRVWDIYLHPGVVLALTGAVAAAENLLQREEGLQRTGVGRRVRYLLACAFAVGLAVASLAFAGPAAASRFLEMARRSEAAVHRKKIAEHAHVCERLARLARLTERRVVALVDPHIYPPESTSEYAVTHFWGPFVQWSAGAEAVIFYASHMPGPALPPPESAEHDAMRRARELFGRHVAPGPGGTCSAQPCYREVPSGLEGVHVFLREDVAAIGF